MEDSGRARVGFLEVTSGEGVGCLRGREGGLRARDSKSALAALRDADIDLVVWDLAVPGLPESAERADFCASGQVGHWLLVGSDAAGIPSALGSPGEFFALPSAAEPLATFVERALRAFALAEEVGRLRARLDTLEECGVLAQCLEAGKVYPLALDLLLALCGRDRGAAIFRRTNLPGNYASVFRGFEDAEAERLNTLLLDGKHPDLDAIPRLACVDRGDLVAAFQSSGCHDGPLLVVPLRGREGEAGLLCVPVPECDLDPDEWARAEIVADRASAALGIAENYQMAKDRAFIDDTTGAYNARYLQSAAENEIRRADRYGTPLSMLFLDLDRFKAVNDSFGHLVGTETLRRLVAVLEETIREVDTLARYGGDEFAILLGGSSHQNALQIAERIRSAVAATGYEAGPGERIRLSVSIGVATHPTHGDTLESLLEAADKAMYRAKSLGRNRVCSAAELREG
jgi:diguanylate cyclase (GGDEF)-like protein